MRDDDKIIKMQKYSRSMVTKIRAITSLVSLDAVIIFIESVFSMNTLTIAQFGACFSLNRHNVYTRRIKACPKIGAAVFFQSTQLNNVAKSSMAHFAA